jgi:hypothetical protein
MKTKAVSWKLLTVSNMYGVLLSTPERLMILSEMSKDKYYQNRTITMYGRLGFSMFSVNNRDLHLIDIPGRKINEKVACRIDWSGLEKVLVML